MKELITYPADGIDEKEFESPDFNLLDNLFGVKDEKGNLYFKHYIMKHTFKGEKKVDLFDGEVEAKENCFVLRYPGQTVGHFILDDNWIITKAVYYTDDREENKIKLREECHRIIQKFIGRKLIIRLPKFDITNKDVYEKFQIQIKRIRESEKTVRTIKSIQMFLMEQQNKLLGLIVNDETIHFIKELLKEKFNPELEFEKREMDLIIRLKSGETIAKLETNKFGRITLRGKHELSTEKRINDNPQKSL